MATRILLPRLGESVEEAVIGRWCKQVGDTVARGDIIAELETAKAMMELESPAKGVLLAVFPDLGETVRMGELVAVVGKLGEDWEAELKKDLQKEELKEDAEKVSAGKKSPAVQSAGKPKREHRRISPSAKRLASELGVNLAEIILDDENTRITSEMVRAFAESSDRSASSDIPGKHVPLNRIQSITAQRMAKSAREIPQFSVSMDVCADRLSDYARMQKEKNGKGITVTAVLVWKVAEALGKHPRCNACYEAASDTVLLYEPINIAVAAAAPQGLYVPVIHAVQNLELVDIAHSLNDLAERTRSGKLKVEDSADATFTISNLGMKGVSSFIPIINPGQAAILGVGAIREESVLDRANNPVEKRIMTLTVTADHRVLDGVAAADFLVTLKNLLEDL
jgi:pyruvate dehydrogenase E2 component (dihydrolipoamide acetyltransferase)